MSNWNKSILLYDKFILVFVMVNNYPTVFIKYKENNSIYQRYFTIIYHYGTFAQVSD